ncbi:MAG: HNH endonuclease [Campylobacterota bacterium]|nr:HNH endonuclease [Campylobacterota bacterium]
MIKVLKNFNNIPEILNNSKREEAFDENVVVKKFEFGKDLYKPESVKKKLYKIYHNKCAYCEKDISDEQRPIEHYRPKDIYYWLAYSWDNLLLSCSRCNTKKGKQFPVQNIAVQYNNQKLVDTHSLCGAYNKIEKPMIINPEQDDIIADIKFYANAVMYSENSRVAHTINKACGLNRDELVQHRVQIINDFKNILQKYEMLYLKNKDITIFEPIINEFLSKVTEENEYYAFRNFIVKNINIFFESKVIKVILKYYIDKEKNGKL